MIGDRLTALVLAGQRPGGDPLASAYGVPHKAAIPVAGRPMGEWAVEGLKGVPGLGRILVAADWRKLGPAVPMLTRLERVVPVAAMPSVAETVLAVLAAVPPPILVTTIDHPLLTPRTVEEFLDKVPLDADAAAAVARRDTILGAYPEARRTWLRFRGMRVSGCNLYLLGSHRAEQVVRFWAQLDRSRKDPAAMARALGPWAVLLGALGLLTMEGAARRLSRKVGARLAVVELSTPEAAIDVDKPEDLRLADTILARRGGQWVTG